MLPTGLELPTTVGLPTLSGGGRGRLPSWVQFGSTLDLDFMNDRSYFGGIASDAFSRLSYSSTSPKMMHGPDGLLGFARHNQFLYSDEFDNAAWTKVATTVVPNAVIAYDGQPADQIIVSATNNIHYVSQALITGGFDYSVSIEAKWDGVQYPTLVMAVDVTGTASFNLQTGSHSGSVGIRSMTSLGNGWYRCTWSFSSASGSSANIRFTVNSNATYTGDGVSGPYVKKAQINRGLTPFDHILTTSAAVYTPAIEYHPTTRKKLGLLVEQAATNYCRRSNEFSDALWNTQTNVTITPAAAVGPDGAMSASKVEATATSPNTILAQTCANAGSASGNTASVYLKKGSGATSGNRLYLYNETTGLGLALAQVNFDTGLLTVSQGNGAVQALPNGWYRLQVWSLTGISANDTLRIYAGYTSNNPAAGEFVYVYGAQLERPIGATSYFQTAGATATRVGDVLNLDTSAFAFNAAAGTMLARFKSFQQMTTGGAVNAGCGLHVAGDTSYAERLNLFYYAQTPSAMRMGTNGRAGNVSVWDVASSQPPNTFVKACVAWAADNVGFSSAGSGPLTDTSVVVPTVNRLAIGRGVHDSQFVNGHVDRITYWPYRMSNAEIVALTSDMGSVSAEDALFYNGEDGFLFGNFAELDELFQSSIGTPAVTADGQTVGMTLDDKSWGGSTLAQVLSTAQEIRGAGVVGLTGSATAATYNASTGAGTATRVDISNQSYVEVPTVPNGTYQIDVENTGATPLNIRQSPPIAAIHQTLSAGVRQTIIVQNPTAAVSFAGNANASAIAFTIHSIKFIPGRSAIQITSGNRPLWKANAGKPYLLFDGSNDVIIPPFTPLASGTGLTMAVAFLSTQGAVQASPMGGGSSVGPARAYICLLSNGTLSVGWGSQINRGGAVIDLRNQNHVVLVTGDVNGREIWLDGVNITADFSAASGAPGGAGNIAIGGRQSETSAVDLFMPGNVSAAVALDRKLSIAEVAFLTAKMQVTF